MELVDWGKTYGWWAPVFYLLVKYGNIAWKKRTGRFVSYGSLEKRIDKLTEELTEHLKEHRVTDKDFAVLQTNHAHLESLFKDMLGRIDKNIDNIWKALDQMRSDHHE